MQSLTTSCDLGRLRLLAEDRLPAEELAGLEQHLEQCAACREVFDRLVGDDRWLATVRRHLGGDPAELEVSFPEALESPRLLAPSDWPDSLGRLGSYEIKGLLGCGGMGIVLKAFDPALNRNVAIKVLSAALATSAAARQRFLREARAAAAVVHTHVVAVFAVVESAGLPFLVMEYVPGRSLQDRLDKQGVLSLTEVLRIGMQTAAGLAAAHAQGLVHRDVKPANILLEDGVERVRLTDFGLVRAAADAAMTRSGVVAGTPHYMAPEQARGEMTDPRADLFGLGSTLYAMCAGFPPFRAETPLAVLKRVCDDSPRSLREINPEIPPWLDAIVARLMAKDPGQRFQTATEVSDLLQRCLAHVQQPAAVPLPPDAVLRQPRPRSMRSRWLRMALVLLGSTALLAGLLALALRETNKAPHPENTSPPSDFHDAPGGALATEPAWSTDDEISGQFAQALAKARRIEAELHPKDQPERDLLSKLLRELTEQSTSLEREITSGKVVPSSDPIPNPSNRR